MRQGKSCWLQNPHDLLLHCHLSSSMDRGLVTQSKQKKKLIKLEDVIYFLKHKTKNNLWLTAIQHKVHTCINADMHVTSESLCDFRSREADINESGWSR